MIIRKLREEEAKTFIQLRLDYLTTDSGTIKQDEEDAIRQQLQDYYIEHCQNQTLITIVAEIEQKIVAVACMILLEKPANLNFVNGKTGTIMNVLTYPEHRRKGIASQLLKALIQEAKNFGVSQLDLMATEDGLAVYKMLGFKESKYTAMTLSV